MKGNIFFHIDKLYSKEVYNLIMRLVSRFLFYPGLLLVVLSGIAIALNHQGFALRIINVSFLFLTLGSIIYIYETGKTEK